MARASLAADCQGRTRKTLLRTVRLAYRDRLPFIECVRSMAQRHYGVEVGCCRSIRPRATRDALFDDGCDVIIEHLEFWRECGYLG